MEPIRAGIFIPTSTIEGGGAGKTWREEGVGGRRREEVLRTKKEGGRRKHEGGRRKVEGKRRMKEERGKMKRKEEGERRM
jgi:hypothetical protein